MVRAYFILLSCRSCKKRHRGRKTKENPDLDGRSKVESVVLVGPKLRVAYVRLQSLDICRDLGVANKTVTTAQLMEGVLIQCGTHVRCVMGTKKKRTVNRRTR